MMWPTVFNLHLAVVCVVTITGLRAEPKLKTYHVDRSKVSVSGISSGAIMASQYHVVHSKEIMGAGIVAGAPYMCSGGILATGMTTMSTPSITSITALEALTASGALFGNVDATYHMTNDRVYIFAGTLDSVINPGNGRNVERYYRHYMSSSHIETEFNIHAEHSMPTKNYGGECGKIHKGSYLNNCNYSAAFHLLNHIYGGIQEPTSTTTAKGQLLKFDQSEFFHLSIPATYSMDSVGYIYIPSGCTSTQHKCKFHVAFHGCLMGRLTIGEEYVRHAGYNEVGELNSIIILYPQVISTSVNPEGCWDWFAYTGPLFATRNGFQITAVHRMVNRVLGSTTSIIG